MPGSDKGQTPHDLAVTHLLDREDAPAAAAIRAMFSGSKGAAMGPEARGQFAAYMESVSQPHDVTFEADEFGGIPGFWAYPPSWPSVEAILYLHGGWFNFGSAKAYCNFVGQLAARTGVRAFIPEYRLAPEHPYPAATDDVLACYRALAGGGIRRIAIVGDSAGGNLALGLAARLAGGAGPESAALVGVAVLSPVTDLTLSGASYQTRADADPMFTRAQVAGLVSAYLGSADPADPLASPLFGEVAAMPPLRIHVGDDEILLDDALGYAARAVAAGVDAGVDVWMGMPHDFPTNVGRLKAAAQALDAVGVFLSDRLQARPKP